MRLLALTVLLVVIAGCTSTQPEPDARVRTPTAGDSLRLAVGETVERGGHAISFVGVVEDSRCPVGAQCVWEGRAQIRVAVDGRPFVLTLPRTGGPDEETQTIEWDGVQVVFVDLEPYPQSPAAPDGAPTVAVLVTRPSNV